MITMLGRWYRKSIAGEGGMNTASTWTGRGKRRQAGSIVGWQRLYTFTPIRNGVVSHLKPFEFGQDGVLGRC